MSATPLEVVISFDTTGSMSSVLGEVKKHVKELISRLLADIAELRIAVIAHGDYGDVPYVTKIQDFTNDVNILCDFITNVESTCGGDFEECYELVLREVRTRLHWSQGEGDGKRSKKRLIMIGDAVPHDVKSRRNVHNIDWKQEVKLLQDDLHLSIYAVQAYDRGSESTKAFWKQLASLSHGSYLSLSELSNIFAILLGICYHEHGGESFDRFEKEMRDNASVLPRDLDVMVHTLTSGTSRSTAPVAPVLHSDTTMRPPTAPALKKSALRKRKCSSPDAPIDNKKVKFNENKTTSKSTSSKSLNWSKWTLVVTNGRKRHVNWTTMKSAHSRDLISWKHNIAGASLRECEEKPRPRVLQYELAVQCVWNGRRVPVYSTYLPHHSNLLHEVMKMRVNPVSTSTSNSFVKERQCLRQQILEVSQKCFRVYLRYRHVALPPSLLSAIHGKMNTRSIERSIHDYARILNCDLRTRQKYVWNVGGRLKCGSAVISSPKWCSL